jgi:2-oxoglutarate dehydrogenase E2 component (dihydrolipoamide succinyltransferase)
MEITVPEVGESIFEALVARWLRHDGDTVAKDEALCEIETDKITFEISAAVAGTLRIRTPAGTTVKIGSVIGLIDETGAVGAETVKAPARDAPMPGTVPPRRVSPSERKDARERVQPGDRGPLSGAGQGEGASSPEPPLQVRSEEPTAYQPSAGQAKAGEDGRTTRTPMTPIRRKIAARLLAARQQTAMLTTFNEADMGRILELRAKHGEQFARRHGVKLGFMSFFVKASVESLKEFPTVNARIDGDDIVHQHFYDIGIAVSGEKGLVVPVLRDAERMHLAGIEAAIADFVARIKSNRLAIADLEGGTFSISNGGVFGSLMSTPIINPPQSAVLGMHAIQERPVARGGEMVIRPMMYLALSYDHRLIDGREAVLFLKKVKEYLEEPEELLLEA